MLPQPYPSTLMGKIRQSPQDFIVEEQMHIPFSGTGEHVWLQVQKTGANTDWVAGQLANAADIPKKDVGYAGLKDRHAVTTQWFSLQMPGREAPDFAQVLSPLAGEIQVLQQQRHDKKLKRGALTGNRFILTLRDCQGDLQQAQSTLTQIAQQGMPNYFGEQRFGHAGNNLRKAEDWFAGKFKPKQRNQRSLYLSAARSQLFNQVLAQRVTQGNWHKRLPGDVFMLQGSSSCFLDDASDDLNARLKEMDLHPTGMMWGRGTLSSQVDMQVIEQAVAAEYPLFCEGLERNGLKQERRALRVMVSDISSEVLDEHRLQIQFTLPAGAYATVLLAQLGQFHESDTVTG